MIFGYRTVEHVLLPGIVYSTCTWFILEIKVVFNFYTDVFTVFFGVWSSCNTCKKLYLHTYKDMYIDILVL